MSEAHQMPLMRGELSNDGPDRAVMGPHAQKCHALQMLRDMRGNLRPPHRFLARQSPRELAGFRNSVTGDVRVINRKDFRVPT
ncbi:MAG: hypothetical protein CR217_18550 [Beijerinckiaceae bacterium]|nr:MAG: hypothetical protein CR217_18550 [Beijerinckiaceae bacterium]